MSGKCWHHGGASGQGTNPRPSPQALESPAAPSDRHLPRLREPFGADARGPVCDGRELGTQGALLARAARLQIRRACRASAFRAHSDTRASAGMHAKHGSFISPMCPVPRPQRVALVQEYMPGGTLRDAIHRKMSQPSAYGWCVAATAPHAVLCMLCWKPYLYVTMSVHRS